VHPVDLTPPAEVRAQSIAERRAEIAARLNQERSARGAPPLALNETLNAAAQGRAESAFDGKEDVRRLVEAAGYEDRLAGEIVLAGEGAFGDRLDGLRESEPDVFADAMSADYRDLGIGLADGERGPTCVLIFGLSLSDEFAAKTAALSDRPKVRREILARVNAARNARRLPPLRESEKLDQAAQSHADDMIRRSYYGHESPEGVDAFARVGRAGYGTNSVGENIAEGQSTAADVMTGWMTSPLHRDHILSITFTEIGIGLAFGKNALGYEIVWVQVFATPRAAP